MYVFMIEWILSLSISFDVRARVHIIFKFFDDDLDNHEYYDIEVIIKKYFDTT